MEIYCLLHVIFSFYFYFWFVEIKKYKLDLVSLLSVDLITGSTVIPVIPHIEGRKLFIASSLEDTKM